MVTDGPKVYEVGGRRYIIAKKCNVPMVDLHFYTDDDACCLGLGFRNNRSLHIKEFIHELVIPFFLSTFLHREIRY